MVKAGTFTLEPLKGKNCKLVLDLGCRILDDLGLNYWLAAGTALGIHRDKGFIEYDTDIDVEVLNLPDRDKLVTDFQSAGFRLIRELIYNNRSQQLAFVHPAENIVFDIYFYTERGDKLINYNDAGILILPKKFIENNVKQATAIGEYFLPSPIGDYLNFRYKGWRTPKRKQGGGWGSLAKNLRQSETNFWESIGSLLRRR